MFDIGWTELLVIGIVALIVVGPKDLPVLFRNVGRFVGKARGMAREFSRAMNEAADESGVRDVAKGLQAATNPMGSAMDGVKDMARDMTSAFDPTKYDKDSETGKLAAERAEQADLGSAQAGERVSASGQSLKARCSSSETSYRSRDRRRNNLGTRRSPRSAPSRAA